jgi:hypothetical protein
VSDGFWREISARWWREKIWNGSIRILFGRCTCGRALIQRYKHTPDSQFFSNSEEFSDWSERICLFEISLIKNSVLRLERIEMVPILPFRWAMDLERCSIREKRILRKYHKMTRRKTWWTKNFNTSWNLNWLKWGWWKCRWFNSFQSSIWFKWNWWKWFTWWKTWRAENFKIGWNRKIINQFVMYNINQKFMFNMENITSSFNQDRI